MPTPDAKTFPQKWVDAWNAHDIEAVLDHFGDDVLFTSPVAARVLPENRGSGCAARTRCGTTGRRR